MTNATHWMAMGLVAAALAAGATRAQVGSLRSVQIQPTVVPVENATYPEEIAPTRVPRMTPPEQVIPAVTAKPKTVDEPVENLIDVLMISAAPNERHQAIHELAKFDWRESTQILAAFVKAARTDSDRAVRVDAIRQIAALKMNVPYVVNHLKYIQKDRDGWVAQEATASLGKLQATR